MVAGLHLHIAQLSYCLQAPRGVRVRNDDPLYRSFVSARAAAAEPEEIRVDLEIGDVPPPATGEIAFDSGESWLASRGGADFCFYFRSPVEPGRYWWRAAVPEGAGPIRLLFDPDLLEDDGATLADPLHYPLDQLLTMWLLPDRRGCLLHAAGAGRGGRAVAFVGRSGAGKTTLMAQLADLADLDRLSDDRVIVSMAGAPAIFGTPWAGEGLVAASLGAELRALVFLHHGGEHRLEAIDAAAAAHQLLPTTSIPWFDEPRATACLATIDELVRSVPAHDLHFRPDRGVAEVVADLLEVE